MYTEVADPLLYASHKHVPANSLFFTELNAELNADCPPNRSYALKQDLLGPLVGDSPVLAGTKHPVECGSKHTFLGWGRGQDKEFLKTAAVVTGVLAP